ncbi:hypothetical protein SteCoe_34175 [Stentor coeruleus]|uniref:Uncharacterized protein n=1 Tax=Stentor coeruleus TaxID=5963 RepID=A0A1R2AV42_9CILI|nr:hypothetical protein SteCoe_34175 [Stentor coeruleus]
MDKYPNLWITKSPKFFATKEQISRRYTQVAFKAKDDFNKKRFKSNDLLSIPISTNNSKQSPIVKAYSNIDQFYNSIRPTKIRTKTLTLIESPFKDKPDTLYSFNSKKTSELIEPNSDLLSEIISYEQLTSFISKLNRNSIKNERLEYQELLLNLKTVLNRVSSSEDDMKSLHSNSQSKIEMNSFDFE